MSTSYATYCVKVLNRLHDAAVILRRTDLNNLDVTGTESVLRQSRSFSD